MKRLVAVAIALFCVSTLSSAQLAFKNIGGAIGFASYSFNSGANTETLSGFLIAAHSDLGELTKDITFVPDVEYVSTSKSVTGGTLKVSDFGINANAHYNFQMEGMLKPYAGAGLGLNFLSSTAVASYTDPFTGFTYSGSATASDTKIGINLLAGINYQLNDQLTLVVEPRYVIISDFSNFQIKAGVTYALK